MPDPRFTPRFPAREQMLGYWVKLDSPVSTERLTRVGYDYSALDAQHGLLSYAGVLAGLTAIDAGRQSGGHGAGSRPPTPRTSERRSTRAGAGGVIVPLVDDETQAAAAVAAATYPPAGRRSYGPMRSGLRGGPTPADSDATRRRPPRCPPAHAPGTRLTGCSTPDPRP